MGVPYCVIKGGRSRLGQVARLKSTAAVALVETRPEDKTALNKVTETIRVNFNDRFEEIRRQWGGNTLGGKSRAKIAKLERAKQREAEQAKASGIVVG